MRGVCSAFIGSLFFALCMLAAARALAQDVGSFSFSFQARDPGPRAGDAGAGGPLGGLSPDEIDFFFQAREVFQEVDSVSGGVAGEEGSGLGPTFNANSCASCHAQPAVGGTSPHPRLG